MAFKGDGVGNCSFPIFNTGVGDFSISGGFIIYPASGAFETVLSPESGGDGYIYADAGGTLKLNLGSGITLSGFSSGEQIPITLSRTGNVVTFSAGAETGDVNYGGISLNYGRFFSLRDVASLRFKNKIGGIWTFSNAVDADRVYNFSQSVGTPNLPDDGTDNLHGTLTGFATGAYDGSGSDSISITSHTNGQFIQRDSVATNSKLVILSGDIAGTAITEVQISVDNGEKITIDASPTVTSWSGPVVISGTQSVQVFGVGSDTISTLLTLVVGVRAVALGDSQQQGYGINAQPTRLPVITQQPLKFDGTNIVSMTDPSSTVGIGGGGGGGSTIPRIAQRYIKDGVATFIYNIGLGGTTASDWQKGGINYTKLVDFVALVGEIEFVMVQIGTNDAAAAVSQVDFTANMNTMVNDINTDFGVKSYLSRFASTSVGSAANRAGILAGIDDIVASNTNAVAGGDLTVIDISSTKNPLNDDVHFKLDADLTQAGDIIYEALNAVVTSNITVEAKNAPDNDYLVTFTDDKRPAKFIASEIVTFVGGFGTTSLPVEPGEQVYALIRDNLDPSIKTAPLMSITS